MNSLDYVSTRLESMIQRGLSKPEIVRNLAPECEGWPYVFGAWGEECTPAGRRRRKRDDHPTIVTKCQVLNGTKADCGGCKWDLPVRMFDCRGFTKWILSQVGIELKGGGATSQWGTKSNWAAQGPIGEMPRDKVCCVFVRKGEKMEHTGLYLGDGSTCECSSGVQYFKQMKSKWTHYAIPAGLYEDPDWRPTLRKGDKGAYVTLLQTELLNRGYSLPKYGADGSFGNETMKAVLAFQGDAGLKQDGIVGENTWAALEGEQPEKYTVTIPHLVKSEAAGLVDRYAGAYMTEEG